MAATTEKLTIAEFERQYGDRKPYHEYWFGEAVAKEMLTLLHGLLPKIIMILLDQAGYRSASEVRLKISADFEPVPDVIATAGRLRFPYPTEPFEVVVEILSPEDSFTRVVRKCRLYSDWGISAIIVLDPEEREGFLWDSKSQSLQPASQITLPNGRVIQLDRAFADLDSELKELQ